MNQKRPRKSNLLQLIVIGGAIAVVIIVGLFSKSKTNIIKYKESQMLMGTVIQLDVCIDEIEQRFIDEVYAQVWKRLEEIAWRMNAYDMESDVSKINNASAAPVMVEADTYQVIQDAMAYAELTDGAFDITVWPLISLWKSAEERGFMPSDHEIKNVLETVGMGHIQLLSDNRVLVRNGLTQVDLGGVAKGYAIDEAARIFRKNGVRHFFIDAGGDIYVGGKNCEGEPWRIGIRDPRDSDKIMKVLILSDQAVATSGDYERYFVIGGKKWSHILDPATGRPQEDVISSTVIAPSAQEADALATALSVLGGLRGTGLIDSLGDKHASLIVKKQDNKKVEEFSSKVFKSLLR